MTRATAPITLASGLLAACLALAVAVHHGPPGSWDAWSGLERFAIALTSVVQVALERLLDGDPDGALKALSAAIRD